MKIPDEIKAFCKSWYKREGVISPFLLMRKFKISQDYAMKILKFLKYPENNAKSYKSMPSKVCVNKYGSA